jgi:phage baseplate assembly protein W
MANREFRGLIAYDLAKKVLEVGELVNTDAIEQSIENILSTSYGERLFNPYFGSPLPLVLFENLTISQGEALLDSLIRAIETWEDRIILLKDRCTLNIDYDNNALDIGIAYVIKSNSQLANFERSVSFNS